MQVCKERGEVLVGTLQGGVVILGIVDLEGEVGWGGCDGDGGEGGGVDEAAVDDVDKEVKMREEVGPIEEWRRLQ